MTLDVPDEWQAKFQAFETADKMLRQRFAADGVSRLNISRTFAAFAGVNTCWRDPAFIVWAGLRGCTKAEDFYETWKSEA